jgi:SAM-dependent methyltransferase
MHESAFDKFQVFVWAYLGSYSGQPLDILDVGSRAIGMESATHRSTILANGWTYFGVDLEAGENVDLVVAESYNWKEIRDDRYDVVLCSQVLEHARYPWRLTQEIARVMRPRGLTFLIAPSAGHVHRYPEDCFRYYPDGLPALVSAAGLQLVEAHVQQRPVYRSNIWRDAIAVAQKPLRSPQEAGRERARLELGRLAMNPDVSPDDLKSIDFTPKASALSPFANFATFSPGRTFADHDATLARKFGPLRRLGAARRDLSNAIKALTRRI